MRKVKTRVSIARISNNPTVRYVNGEISKDHSDNKDKAIEMMALKCSELSDNKTSYVQKREWDIAVQNYRYPPYVDCDYVD
jgi:hypothetical protein